MSGKKPLLETLLETLFGKPAKEKPHTRKRSLGLEQLEVRELLSATVGFHSVQHAYEGGDPGYFRLERDDVSGALTVNYEVDWRNMDGCAGGAGWATAGSDFAWLPGTGYGNGVGYVTFAAGQQYANITVTALNDTVVEGTETVRLTLISDPYGGGCYGGCGCGGGGPSYVVNASANTATLNIYDDDVAPTVWVEKVEHATEGGASGYIRIQRDVATSALTVRYQLHGNNGYNYGCGPVGWASNGIDFSWLPGTDSDNNIGYVTFAAGQSYSSLQKNCNIDLDAFCRIRVEHRHDRYCNLLHI